MDVVKQSETWDERLKAIVRTIRYGRREQVLLLLSVMCFIASGLLSFKLPESFADFLDLVSYTRLVFLSASGLLLFAGGVYVWRHTLPASIQLESSPTKPIPFKGPGAFGPQDAELFSKLGRNKETEELLNGILDDQISLIVVMGESGCGKTSLLRAGLTHALKDCKSGPIYWEASPRESEQALLHSLRMQCGTEMNSLDEATAINDPRFPVIIIDQFEQLKMRSDKAIFECLKSVAQRKRPVQTTWIVSFQRDYAADWMDFEQTLKTTMPRLSVKRFSESQATAIVSVLSEIGNLDLSSKNISQLIHGVAEHDEVSPVDLGICMLVLSELSHKQDSASNIGNYLDSVGHSGLLTDYLNDRLEQITESDREGLLRALLLLFHPQTDQRISEGKSVKWMAKTAGLTLRRTENYLDYLASPHARILEQISNRPKRYRLVHNRLIAAIRNLTGAVLPPAEQASSLLDRKYRFWARERTRKYLLSSKDLSNILKFRDQLIWGEHEQAKRDYVRQSVSSRTLHRTGIGVAVTAVATLFAVGLTWELLRIDDSRQAILKEQEETKKALDNQRQANELLFTSLEQFADLIMQDEVLATPQLQTLRTRLLMELADQYRIWSEQKTGTSEELARAAQGTIRLAKIEYETGHLSRALEASKQAVELANSSVASANSQTKPKRSQLAIEATREHALLAILAGKLDLADRLIKSAETQYADQQKLLTDAQKLVESSAIDKLKMSLGYQRAERSTLSDTRIQWMKTSLSHARNSVAAQKKLLNQNSQLSTALELVAAQNTEALTLHKLTRRKEAIEVYRNALSILNARDTEHLPDQSTAQIRQLQIRILFNAILSYRGEKDFEGVKQVAQEGIKICHDMKKQHPLVIRYSQELARGYGNYAEALWIKYLEHGKSEMDLEQAIKIFRSAGDEYSTLLQQYPERRGYAGGAAIQYLRLSYALHAARQDNEALTAFRKCLEFSPQPEDLEPLNGSNTFMVLTGYCLLCREETPHSPHQHRATKKFKKLLDIFVPQFIDPQSQYARRFVHDPLYQQFSDVPGFREGQKTVEKIIQP
ncbi:nSTAND1 domain-containing NTPase [Gimesia aquarii]|uniref:Novel STAND NTPase 1 domain-containing protein n=1 Tax=Gimesia aquarii TaxID=2527964 RepID=A0A517W426_9PLAN|nr:hypothetical protein [Gimesia aquarii]QDT99995.1 hypothetical protein V144x_55090 [Gimesia aquarii]